jgi:transcriptional regulator with XRE-family HTH domain
MRQPTLGQLLEALREESGLTLNRLSQDSGIPLTSVHRLFRDQVAKPNPAYLVALARVLGAPPRPLLALAGYPATSDPVDLAATLRAAYPLPDEAITDMLAAIDAVAARYTELAKTGEAK